MIISKLRGTKMIDALVFYYFEITEFCCIKNYDCVENRLHKFLIDANWQLEWTTAVISCTGQMCHKARESV